MMIGGDGLAGRGPPPGATGEMPDIRSLPSRNSIQEIVRRFRATGVRYDANHMALVPF
jgi:hypothetical protein